MSLTTGKVNQLLRLFSEAYPPMLYLSPVYHTQPSLCLSAGPRYC
jgi:hypothetical protein